MGLGGCEPDTETYFVYEGQGGVTTGDPTSVEGESPGDQIPSGETPAMGGATDTPPQTDAAESEPRLVIRGVVQRQGADQHGGIRIEALDTDFVTFSATTGRFALRLSGTMHTLQFSAEGYGTQQLALPPLESEGMHNLDDPIVLSAQPGVLTGQVTLLDLEDRGRIEDVRIVLHRPEQDPEDMSVLRTSPDSQGAFRFEVAPGEYVAQFTAEGFVTQRRAVTMTPGGRIDLGLTELRLLNTLGATGVIGTVQRQGASADGHGGIRVESIGTNFATVSTSGGGFQLNLIPGAHTLRFTAEGYGTVDQAIAQLDAGEMLALSNPIVLSAQPGQIVGFVTLPQGFRGAERLAQVSVVLQRVDAEPGADPVGRSAVDAQGRFDLGGINPGEYSLVVDATGFSGPTRVLVLGPGTRMDVGEIRLELEETPATGPTAIEGTAQRDGLSDHSGIQVEAIGTPFATVTTSTGAYRLEVTPGGHTLRFAAPGYGAIEQTIAEVAARITSVEIPDALDGRYFEAVFALPADVEGPVDYQVHFTEN